MNIALDISGGDNSPISTIDGAINFIKNNTNPNLHLTLIGLKDEFIPFEKIDGHYNVEGYKIIAETINNLIN